MIFSGFPYRAQLMSKLGWAGEVIAGQIFKWQHQPHAETLDLLFFLVTTADDEGVCIHVTEAALLDKTYEDLKKKCKVCVFCSYPFFLNSLTLPLALNKTQHSKSKERDKEDILLPPCTHPSVLWYK